MPDEASLPAAAQHVADIVRNIVYEVRPRLVAAALSGVHGESANVRHADNFLSVHDLWMHRRYQQLLTARLGSFVYASEEAEPLIVGDDPEPDLCILVDPLDTSELAVRGLHGYTHVMLYSRSLARPIVSVVGDIYHHIQLYVAARTEQGEDRAYVVTADSTVYPIGGRAQQAMALHESLITNYLMRPAERFVPLARQDGLLQALGRTSTSTGQHKGRIGVDFGSVGLCHVAAGFTDAMIEFAKGFAVWDLAPGQYILQAAGGTVVDLDGVPIELDHMFDSLDDIAAAMRRRQKFVAVRTPRLAEEILDALQL